MRVTTDTKHPVKIWASDLEQEAEAQVKNAANLPFIFKHVAVMPDAHAGKGSTVGTVLATRGAIIPSCVGVDIGCGMNAVKLPVKIDAFDKLSQLRNSIERSIPLGHNENSKATLRMDVALQSLGIPVKNINWDKALKQIGTLGGGNHFIELCQDQNNDAWVVLHSGSRNVGKVLADMHITDAKDLMKKYFIDLPDPDLAYLVQGTQQFDDYIKDLNWGQNYAKANRNEMMLKILKDISYHLYKEDKGPENMTVLKVDCHHNYTQQENHFGANVWVTRKGAVSAKAGELGIIPGSMGAKSYIVEGLGNPESFCSCSHGAGRKMSRTKAKELFTLQDLANQTSGVECRKDLAVIDEIPGAYKNIDTVMEDQKDLVKPLFELKQVLCVKG
jgi:tRNA-splicing ligase RtcB